MNPAIEVPPLQDTDDLELETINWVVTASPIFDLLVVVYGPRRPASHEYSYR